MQAKKKKVLTYKGKPLYRVGDTLYYGDLSEKYIMQFDIADTKKIMDFDATTKVVVKLISNMPETSGQVFRHSERENLYSALDIGEWWLKTALMQ